MRKAFKSEAFKSEAFKSEAFKSEAIKAVIVDDEALARDSLRDAIKDFDIEVVAECGNGFEAVTAVQEFHPDVIFLDVRMPRLDGFDVVELLGKDAPFIIFVTSFDEYAVRAFEAEALDYILKPVKPERLKKPLERLRAQLGKLDSKESQPMETLLHRHRDQMAPLSRVLIRAGTDVVIVPVKDILYIEAQDDYVKIYTENKSYLKSEGLSRLEKTMDPHSFCRIHRSYLLNIESLKKIEPYSKDSRLAILNNGKKLPISRTGYTRLMEFL
ncbi:MAG: response regulator [bacterium]|nr:response regulator [bacterium]